MHTKKFFHAGVCALLALIGTTAAHAGCYSIYNGKGTLEYRSDEPQVDMSYQLHRTMPKKFGRNSSMVFESPTNTAGRCVEYSRRATKQNRATQDMDVILQNLADRYVDPRGKMGIHSVGISDVRIE